MKRLAPLVAALAVLAASCGGEADPRAVLGETAANLGDIKSGELSVRFLATAEGEEGGQVGFELDGPFALPDEGELPIAEMEYTQIAGDEEASATFLSTGETAYVELDGTVYELPEEQQQELRGAGARLREEEGLGALDIERWIEDAKLSDGGEVGGAETDRIAANVDVVNAVNDLIDIVGEFRELGIERLEGQSAEQLERAVESATIEVWTGKDDRLLRRLRIRIDLAAPSDLPPEVRDLLRAGLEFELGITDPNRPVRVDEPADAEPFPAE